MIAIKELRNKLGLTQAAFANEVGVDFVTVSRWERGVAKPSKLAMNKINRISRRVGLNSNNSKSTMKIAFIGGGNMAEAMVSAIKNKGLSRSEYLTACEVKEERRQYLAQQHSIGVTDDSKSAVKEADVVVLAVKPQNLAEAMAGLKGKLKPEQLVISIIAGARIQTLRTGLDHNCIVRSMPNTPAQIGDGMTVWTATPEVTERQKKQAGAILGAMGKEICTKNFT